MLSQEIRQKYLEYFNRKGHAIVSSSSVVPHEDPTILFNNAGMNQFKDVFLGKSKRDYTRATSVQKCIRVGGKHNDLDNVGHTTRHLTFFEMLGNFSFGDYFKKEAIEFAWEVTHEVFDFETDKLWVTVFEDDEEAYEIWEKIISPDRIVRMGEKDNFWAMGETGPCGPCSELYYDRGETFGDASSPLDDASGERYLEYWNLVFMQFNRDKNGKMRNLPTKAIDTGAGLERIISLKLGVDNVFHTDILREIISCIEKQSKVKYDEADEKLSPAFHVIADHIRSISFAIADGAQPSNIERGYVLRKLLRRAVRYGRTLLGFEEPFLADIFPALLKTMGGAYPQLKPAESRICEILTLEEEGFIRTLKRGGNILSNIVEKAMESPRKEIGGDDAFKLKDTYGFPLEEILLIAKDSNLQVNIDAYQLLEEKAKELSRSARSVKSQTMGDNLFANFTQKKGESTFVGYGEVKTETTILAIIQGQEFVESLSEGSEASIVLKETPFYAEKGGQTADVGIISTDRARFRVVDCQNPFPGVFVHRGTLEHGTIKPNDPVSAAIDSKRRANISAHHTATHILHWALQQILGGHIRQGGSLVEESRLRFDFSHHKSPTLVEIREIEDLVNEKIRENQSVSTYEIPYEEAQNRAEIKQFFGEKYGSHVRVVDLVYSKELCGGTHAYHVGMLGYFRITKESSIAAGVRRIEASCGRAAEEFVRHEEDILNASAALLKAQPSKLDDKVEQMIEENTELKQTMRALRKRQLTALSQELAESVDATASRPTLKQVVEIESEDLPDLAEAVLAKIKRGIIVLAIRYPERMQLLIKVSADLVKEGVSAGLLIKEISPLIGGGGGGRPDSAQAGGKNPDGIDAAFAKLEQLLSNS